MSDEIKITREEFKDIVRLGVMEGMDQHRKEDHAPLWRQIEKINVKIAIWAGGAAATTVLMRMWLR